MSSGGVFQKELILSIKSIPPHKIDFCNGIDFMEGLILWSADKINPSRRVAMAVRSENVDKNDYLTEFEHEKSK